MASLFRDRNRANSAIPSFMLAFGPAIIPSYFVTFRFHAEAEAETRTSAPARSIEFFSTTLARIVLNVS